MLKAERETGSRPSPLGRGKATDYVSAELSKSADHRLTTRTAACFSEGTIVF